MENNKTNIEKADEIAGYFGQIGLIPFKTPYIGFSLVPKLQLGNAYKN